MNIVSYRNLTAFIILKIIFSLFYYSINSWPAYHSQKTHHGLIPLIFHYISPPLTLPLCFDFPNLLLPPWITKQPNLFPYSPSASSIGGFKLPFQALQINQCHQFFGLQGTNFVKNSFLHLKTLRQVFSQKPCPKCLSLGHLVFHRSQDYFDVLNICFSCAKRLQSKRKKVSI